MAAASPELYFPTQALRTIGFEIDESSPEKVSGRLQITAKCCQPFGVLHGGVSAMIAEELGSYGAFLASGRRGAAGIQLSINHLKSAQIGDLVLAEATPVNAGRTVQVWEVRLLKVDPENAERKSLIASSRVTLFCLLTFSIHHLMYLAECNSSFRFNVEFGTSSA